MHIHTSDKMFNDLMLEGIKKIDENDLDSLAKYAVSSWSRFNSQANLGYGKRIRFAQWYKHTYCWRYDAA